MNIGKQEKNVILEMLLLIRCILRHFRTFVTQVVFTLLAGSVLKIATVLSTNAETTSEQATKNATMT